MCDSARYMISVPSVSAGIECLLVQAFKHELYSQPMLCWEAPFCKIARRASTCERYDSCWQLVWQMLHPVQHCRAQIGDVINSKFMVMD